MIAFIITYFVLAIIGLFITVTVLAARELDKKGLKVEKRTRQRWVTLDDGLGKNTTLVTEEEYVTVPKEESRQAGSKPAQIK
ncbi:MAG: hypothetical protein J6Z79_01680 [Clostridia bacterium]|nr:hypothetical protein [Clostridia bacterium]